MDGGHYTYHIVIIITYTEFVALLSDLVGTSSQGIKTIS